MYGISKFRNGHANSDAIYTPIRVPTTKYTTAMMVNHLTTSISYLTGIACDVSTTTPLKGKVYKCSDIYALDIQRTLNNTSLITSFNAAPLTYHLLLKYY
jgi:hypothetical protein